MSKRTHKELRRKARCSFHLVPVDLRGLCFNCFSPRHRAASCNSALRCFRCRAVGHRSFVCRVRSSGASKSTRPLLVWRPASRSALMTTPPVSAAATYPSMGATPFPVQPGAGTGQRWRARKCRRNGGSAAAPLPGPGNFGGSSSPSSSEDDDRAPPLASRPYALAASSFDWRSSLGGRNSLLAVASSFLWLRMTPAAWFRPWCQRLLVGLTSRKGSYPCNLLDQPTSS